MKKQEIQKQETQIAKANFEIPEELKTSVGDVSLSLLVPYIASASSGKITLRNQDSEERVVQQLEGVVVASFKTTSLRRAAAWPQKKDLLQTEEKKWPAEEREILAMAYENSEGNIDQRFFSNRNLQKTLRIRNNVILLTKNGNLVRIVGGKPLKNRFKGYAQQLAIKGNDPIAVNTLVEPVTAKTQDGAEYTTFSFSYQGNLQEDFFANRVLPIAKTIRQIILETQKYYESLPKVWSADQSFDTGNTFNVSASESSIVIEEEISDSQLPF